MPELLSDREVAGEWHQVRRPVARKSAPELELRARANFGATSASFLEKTDQGVPKSASSKIVRACGAELPHTIGALSVNAGAEFRASLHTSGRSHAPPPPRLTRCERSEVTPRSFPEPSASTRRPVAEAPSGPPRLTRPPRRRGRSAAAPRSSATTAWPGGKPPRPAATSASRGRSGRTSGAWGKAPHPGCSRG